MILKLLTLLFLMLVLIFTGCESIDTNLTALPIDRNTTSETTIIATSLPYLLDTALTISKAPAIGETADITFTVYVKKLDEETHPREGLAKSKAWIEFYWTNIHGSYSEAYGSVQVPLEEALLGGDFPWEGSYTENLTLHGKFALPKEGVWNIRAHFTGEGWSYGTGGELWVAVADGMAAIMDTPEFNNSSLSYLANFAYGKHGGPIVPNMISPVSVGLDISKAPGIGEEVALSCRILSLVDEPDFSLQWYFYQGKDKIPESELLTSKDLNRKTDITKNVPVTFATTIKFPEEGQWEVVAVGKSGDKYIASAAFSIKFTITPNKSYWGWQEITIRPATYKDGGTTTTAPAP